MDHTERQGWMALLARADAATLRAAVAVHACDVPWTRLRPTEIGMTMLRGRAGGDGAAFNLGEVTLTRASIRVATGAIGHAYILGRDRARAEDAAILDALMQDPARAGAIREAVLAPVAAQVERKRADVRARAAGTKVEFFTMVRMG